MFIFCVRSSANFVYSLNPVGFLFCFFSSAQELGLHPHSCLEKKGFRCDSKLKNEYVSLF